MKKIKTYSKNLALLLAGLILFSQISSTHLPYLVREYVVLIVIQLYFAIDLIILPKLKANRSDAQELKEL